MSTTRVSGNRRERLAALALVDSNVELRRVRLHVGGPATWYLKLVKKSAITLGDHVWFVSEAKREDLDLLVHELVHVGQYRELGKVRFLARYARDMARAGFKYSKELPLEAPAYERQALARELLRDEPVSV
ncbi:MAG: DUF4157 domain-containing protein [Dehalococcoidia bacterium]|nr:DUF4157 domain-containing protein [Dehalococcoidia bacterium]